MNTENSNIINGFVKGDDNKLRLNGKMVSNVIAEQALAGAIIADFNPASLRAKKARKAQSGTADMVAALREISPAIEVLKVGMTAKIPMPKAGKEGKDPKRSFVMSIVTKLNSVTQAGREWSGRVFDSLSDEDGEFFYVTRLPDTAEPHVRKQGGGRKSKASQDSLAEALQRSKEHLSGNNGGEAPKGEEKPVAEVADDIMNGKEAVIGASNEPAVLEDATVIHH